MFEKEAKAYKEIVMKEHLQNPFPRSVEDVWQDGAKFGYNKANEWHKVADGDLPKENQLVLLYRENPNGANIALTYWYKSYVNDKVIAWKEIVLPELKESE